MSNAELRRALQVAMCQLPITGKYRRANGILVYERRVIGQNCSGRYDLVETTTRLKNDFTQSSLSVKQETACNGGPAVRYVSLLDGRQVTRAVGFGELLSEGEYVAAAIELLSGCSNFDRIFVVSGENRSGW